jgi:hypothetical protein
VPSVAQRETATDKAARPVSRGVSHPVELPATATGVTSPGRHLSLHASALAQPEAQRRQAEMGAIEAARQRLQGVVNQYDAKRPAPILRRVQEKAGKKRAARP